MLCKNIYPCNMHCTVIGAVGDSELLQLERIGRQDNSEIDAESVGNTHLNKSEQ